MVFQQDILLKNRWKVFDCVNLLAFCWGLNARIFFQKTASEWFGDVQLQCVLALYSNLAGLSSIFDVWKQDFVVGFYIFVERFGKAWPIEEINQNWDVAFFDFLF